MRGSIGFAGVQMEIFPGEANIDRMAVRLDAIHRDYPWVELVLFSELCLFGADPGWARAISGEEIEKLRGLARAHGLWLVPGTLYEETPGGYYNTAPVIDPGGRIVAAHRKLYPWLPVETSTPGREFCVFDIPGRARVGVCTCYDQWFPEVARQLAWMGAEIILNPTRTTTPDRSREVIIAQANAIFNQVYFVSVNGLGHGGNGRSILVDPDGVVVTLAGEEEAILTTSLDLDLVARVRREGTMGQCQALKSFRDAKIEFPVYARGPGESEAFRQLGPIIDA
ncbi:MAG: carbon-nitrogen hydrolase family protein [Desulfobacterales bacterium]|nr:carbon-nitrogen hydrolase family protein [Desulfobacterales bacterium]